jgi:hypothetical protein
MSTAEKVRTLIFDESGNLGKDRRYFVIACIDTYNARSLHIKMKKKLLAAKRAKPELPVDGFEIKACNADRSTKISILSSIVKKELSISYIVADLLYVFPNLLEDKNCFYNYMIKLIVDDMIKNSFTGKKLRFRLDNKTVKVKSENTFKEYINIHLNYERTLNLALDVRHIDSRSGDGFVIQAADYVANAIYAYYEYGNSMYFDILRPAIKHVQLFPRSKFGK